MTLESAYYLIQIVAGTAVVISLIYLGVGVRHNTRAAKLAAVQAVQAAIGRTEEMIIQDKSFAELLMRGLTVDASELGGADRIRLNVFYRHTLRTYQSAHYQFRNAVLEASVWKPQEKALAAIFHADRGLRRHFEVEKYMLDGAFVTLCERLLHENSDLQITSAEKPA